MLFFITGLSPDNIHPVSTITLEQIEEQLLQLLFCFPVKQSFQNPKRLTDG